MRARDLLGVDLSEQLSPGPLNAITDVGGVAVGQVTLAPDDEPHIRTGVTAILPAPRNLWEQPVYAAVHTMNGFGKATGFEQVRETGYIQAPILLTNTLSVGTALDAGYQWMVRHNPPIADGGRSSINVVVAECNDSFLNDMRGFHITHQHVWDAIESATGGPVMEGAVGAATGTACYQFKGGIGTASRVTPEGYTVGVLTQTNMGRRNELRVFGARVGKHLTEGHMPETPAGSVILIVATDAPATVAHLGRLARRVPFGLARTGTSCAHGSGDFAIAFSTTDGGTLPDDPVTLDALFAATVEATEEAVLNALFAAKTVTGKNGNTLYGVPLARVREHIGRSSESPLQPGGSV